MVYQSAPKFLSKFCMLPIKSLQALDEVHQNFLIQFFSWMADSVLFYYYLGMIPSGRMPVGWLLGTYRIRLYWIIAVDKMNGKEKAANSIKLTAMQSQISNTSYYALLTSIIAISQDIRPRTTSYFILSYPISAKNLS